MTRARTTAACLADSLATGSYLTPADSLRMSAATLRDAGCVGAADWHKSEEAQELIAAWLALETARDALPARATQRDDIREVMDSIESDLDALRDDAKTAVEGPCPDGDSDDEWTAWDERCWNANADAPTFIKAVTLFAQASAS